MKTKTDKEAKILQAAEQIFEHSGFSNANMDVIAKKAGVSKGTVYFYFDSKENLYMALAYKALNVLNDKIYQTVHDHRKETGCQAVVGIMKTFLEFNERFPFYAEAMLDYMALVRSTNSGKTMEKASKAMQDSLYFRKLHSIHNVPVNLVVEEIKRGREDGSIQNNEKSEKLYLTAWALTLGFMKISHASLPHRNTIHTVSIADWKGYILETIEGILKDQV